MNAPVNKFVREYAKSGIARFHMPGHKGQKFHGLEPWDITEIKGADYLFEAEGIIAQSEAKMANNGPVSDQMKKTVNENIWHDSLVNWLKSFR